MLNKMINVLGVSIRGTKQQHNCLLLAANFSPHLYDVLGIGRRDGCQSCCLLLQLF